MSIFDRTVLTFAALLFVAASVMGWVYVAGGQIAQGLAIALVAAPGCSLMLALTVYNDIAYNRPRD